MGFLERENAAILNASILPFARKIVASFQFAIQQIGIACPLLLTQNDGTVVSASTAAELPIRTFSSGATNSMRGAAFLAANHPELAEGPAVVADIGGTTCDVGMLLKNGFPRLSAAFSTVGGVRMNFAMPHVESIGLGGGSIVRELAGGLISVGPDSVGSDIVNSALVYGGSITTTTDIMVAIAKKGTEAYSKIGTRALVEGKYTPEYCQKVSAQIKTYLESVIDRIKTSPDPIPVLLVGGGALIAPSELKGASKVILPPYSGVANAVGAALGKVSGMVDSIETVHAGFTEAQAQEKTQQRAIEDAIKHGALASTVIVTEVDTLPLQYTANKVRILVKATGDIDFKRLKDTSVNNVGSVTLKKDNLVIETGGEVTKNLRAKHHSMAPQVDIAKYAPTITSDREWLISEVDVQFISVGAYILGTGGGGSPYLMELQIKEILRNGGTVSVRDIDDIRTPDATVSMCGFAGSPTVLSEQICVDEISQAYNLLSKSFMTRPPDGIVSIEIGGSNGLQSLYMASSAKLNVACIDGDFMGRAYPTLWQVTPYALQASPEEDIDLFTPLAISDGNGNTSIVASSESMLMTEKLVRANLSELGSAVGFFTSPIDATKVRSWLIRNTISQAWRIGRAVHIARRTNQLDNVGQLIIDSVGGPETARELFRGKIVGIERRLQRGHVYGEVVIEAAAGNETGEPQRLMIPFKNENIYARLQTHPKSNPNDIRIVASVPDLISVIDEKTGEAIGTPEYRYGLHVFVLAIAGSDHWTATERAMNIGGPAAFGFEDVKYEPVGVFKHPRSVIEEYSPDLL